MASHARETSIGDSAQSVAPAAMAEFHLGRTSTAMRDAESSVELAPADLYVRLIAGDVELTPGDFGTALRHILSVYEELPNDRIATTLLARSVVETGDLDRAVELLLAALGEHPADLARSYALATTAASFDPRIIQATKRAETQSRRVAA